MSKLSSFLVNSILEDEVSAAKKTSKKLDETPLHISKEVIEEWVSSRLTTILKEASKTGGFLEVDDGPNFFFRDFRVFDKVSRRRAEQIGYEVVKQIMDASFQDLTVYPEYPTGPVKSVTPFPAGVIGKTTATNQKDFDSPRAYDLWFRHAKRVATIVGYTLVKEKDAIERRLAVGNLDDIYDDETAKEPSSVNESTFFTKGELEEITNDIMNELGGLMIGYAGKDDIRKKQTQLKKLRKKLDKTTSNYPVIKETYNKLEFYLNYYKNLSPSGFTVKNTKDTIIISPNDLRESDMGGEPYVVDIDDLTINNTKFRTTKWTGDKLQMTVMDIPNGQDIGLEVHNDGDQFIRVESGEGEVHMGKSKEKLDYLKKIKDDTAIFIPAGYWHNIKNTSTDSLKLYVIYAPVEHKRGRVDVNKPIELNERSINAGIYRGPIKVDGKSVEIEVELYGADNTNRTYKTRIMWVPSSLKSKFKVGQEFPIPVKAFHAPRMGSGWRRVKIGGMFEAEKYINEDITIPVNVGDTILTGRFKNKKTKVNTIGKDEHGMPTVNGRKVVNFRIEKPSKESKL